MGRRGIKGMKLKENQLDALQEGISAWGHSGVTRAGKLRRVKGEVGGTSPGDTL